MTRKHEFPLPSAETKDQPDAQEEPTRDDQVLKGGGGRSSWIQLAILLFCYGSVVWLILRLLG